MDLICGEFLVSTNRSYRSAAWIHQELKQTGWSASIYYNGEELDGWIIEGDSSEVEKEVFEFAKKKLKELLTEALMDMNIEEVINEN
jgi:hypothetical protein